MMKNKIKISNIIVKCRWQGWHMIHKYTTNTRNNNSHNSSVQISVAHLVFCLYCLFFCLYFWWLLFGGVLCICNHHCFLPSKKQLIFQLVLIDPKNEIHAFWYAQNSNMKTKFLYLQYQSRCKEKLNFKIREVIFLHSTWSLI